ncbi:MAG: histidine phosphatase family protein [Clostridia bacterium]|nr:histidine phosphatase family protein [Clostridia bacterium]
MKILIIRHGDPDYSIDSLTEKGRREAELLSERISKLDVKKFYVSTLGRARATAQYTLDKMGRTAEVCEWLKEFPPIIDKPNRAHSIAWDWLPEDWTDKEEFFDKDAWGSVSNMKNGKVKEEFDRVNSELDKVLAQHGYKRENNYYRVENANEDTIVFFCHFGLECVLLSHLLNVSPLVLWHGFFAAPTSVTTLITEERRKGIAYFRASGLGDISHLYAGGEEPSFSGRFCETFDNAEQRHD